MSNESQVLSTILSHQKFRHYKEVSEGEWRDADTSNPSLTLSVRGWYNHKTGDGGSLYDFASDNGIELPRNLGKENNTSIVAASVYKNANSGAQEIHLITKYFETRGLKLDADYIDNLGLKVSVYKGNTEIFAPMYDTEGAIVSIYRIPIDPTTFTKKGKSTLLGKGTKDRAVMFGDLSSDKAYAFEGLEDAISFELNTHTGAVLVSGGATHWSKLDSLLLNYSDCTIVLDPDENHQSLVGSVGLGNRVKRVIPSLGVDCNAAVMEYKFDDWLNSLERVDYKDAVSIAEGIKKIKNSSANAAPMVMVEAMDGAQLVYGTQLTEMGNAERMVRQHGGNMRHCAATKTWYLWNGVKWAEDSISEIERFAKQTIKSLFHEAHETEDDNKAKAILKHALLSETWRMVTNMVKMSASDRMIAVDSMSLDKDRNLLNFENGIYDLDSGKFFAHNKELLITKQVHTVYDPTAVCPKWLQFLRQISCEDPTWVDSVQRALGYTISGYTTEEKLFFCYGGGKNGKSTLLGTIERLFDDYSGRISSERLAYGKGSGGSVPNDLAELRGARLAIGTEIQENMRLHEAKIKDMTGQDKLQARFLFGNLFTYYPQFKLWMYGNHKPIIRGASGESIWRRLLLIPFDYTVTKVDYHLKDELIDEEGPGIVQWCIEGYTKWKDGGLTLCDRIKGATQDYRDSEDILGQFLSTFFEKNRNTKTALDEVHNKYLHWAEDAMLPEIPKVTLRRLLEGMGYSCKTWLKRKPEKFYRKSVIYGLRAFSDEELDKRDITPIDLSEEDNNVSDIDI